MALTTNPVVPGQPLALTDEWIKRVVSLQTTEGTPLDNAPTATVANGVAIIPVSGPLSKEPSIWSWIFGGSNYESIAKDIRQAVDSAEVSTIILKCDSPGGDVAGCDELSAMIDAASAKKRVVTYVSGNCASAAYWLCSAANEIVIDSCAVVGSIGVKTTLVDTSKAESNAGIVVYEIESDQSPLKIVDPSAEADRIRVKSMLTDLAAVFIGRVARNRGVATSRVKEDFGKGSAMIGDAAIKAGLADRLGNFEDLLAELSGESMKTPKNPLAASAVTAGVSNGKCSACRADMDDGDPMYCKSCYGGADAQAAVNQLLAATGKETIVEAIGVLSAWKELAAESASLKAQIEEQRKAAELASFDAEIAAAKANGLLAKSDEHKRNKAALVHRGKPGALDGLRSFLAALDPLSAPNAAVATQAPRVEKPVTEAISGLSAEEQHVIKALGMDPEKYLAQKSVLKNPRNHAAEEK